MKISVSKLSQQEIQDRKIERWPIWTCEISEFDWEYAESEVCLLLEGKVLIQTETDSIMIQSGDFVSFPKGLKCRWQVLQPVRKHYEFK